MGILTSHAFGRPQPEPEPAPTPGPTTITPGVAKHILNLVVEYGGLVRQECDYRHLAGSEKYGAHVANAAHAREMQVTYYETIRDLLGGAR